MNQLYLSSSPHVHSGETIPKVMRAVLYSLAPACGVAVYFFGVPALGVLLIATLGCLATEAVCQRLMGQTVTIADGSAAITGVLLALNLPPTSPWWLTLLGAVIAIAIGKQVYGGLGANAFNPALVARVVLLISFPVQMTTWSAPAPLGSGLDLVTTATPLGEWKNGVMLTGEMPAAMQSSMPARLSIWSITQNTRPAAPWPAPPGAMPSWRVIPASRAPVSAFHTDSSA